MPDANEFDGLIYDVQDPVNEYGEPLPAQPEGEGEPTGEGGAPQEDNTDTPPAKEPSTDEPPAEPEPTPEPVKPAQSPEDNAKFAEARRQKQMQEQLQKEMEERPEFQMAKFLSEQYGLTPDQLFQQMREEALQKQSEQQGVPIEYLREQQQIKQENQNLKQAIDRLEFNAWYAQRQAEAETVKNKYNGVISDQDINEALLYVTETLKTTNVELDKAVRLVHGDKIEAELRRFAKQEALAEISGRKPAPLAPQGGKATPTTPTLTEAERYFAKMMGVTEEDYLKNK